MRKQFIFFTMLLLSIIFIGSCRPSIGTAWYNKSIQQEKPEMVITFLSVNGISAVPIGSTLNTGNSFGHFMTYQVEFEAGTYDIGFENIVVEAVDAVNRNKKINVSVSINDGDINLSPGTSTYVTLKIQDYNSEYEEVEKILRLAVEEGDSVESGYILGADGKLVENPIDKYGNKKYIVSVQTIYEEKPPFEGYDKDFEFPASKFNDWILNMPSMTGKIASYQFFDGSWTGIPEECSNPNLGGGLTAVSDVKIFRYKTRADRWSKHGGYNPNLNPDEIKKEERFYFYRFTGGISIGSLDNSMFCVDTHSKFLFYYSDPADISSVGVPSNWKDYSQPNEGKHKQFSKPFYMSDPIGFVKKSGAVVIYDWVKNKIKNNDYTAFENNFSSPAEKSRNTPGYSPYRKDMLKFEKKITNIVENPDYTAVHPLIVKQPKSISVKPGVSAVFSIKVKDVPKDINNNFAKNEELSFQWYTNTKQSTEGGKIADGQTGDSFTLYKDTESETYIYCIVTNKNKSNNLTEITISDIVKFTVTNGDLLVDAAFPNILEQPMSKNVNMGKTVKVRLNLKAESSDGGKLSYQWYKSLTEDEASGEKIDGAVEPKYIFQQDTKTPSCIYYYCIVTNTNNSVNGKKTAEKISRFAKIEVEKASQVNFSSGGGGTLTAFYNGRAIKSGDYVKVGGMVRFIATSYPGYYIANVEGLSLANSKPDLFISELAVTEENINVSIGFKKPNTLIISPKIYNETLKSWSTADEDHLNHKYLNGAHFAYDFKIFVSENGYENSTQWKYDFPIEGTDNWLTTGISNGGHGEYVKQEDFIENGKFKELSETPFLKKEFTSFANIKVSLNSNLIKSNRHDFWRTEKTWLGGGPVYKKQVLDNNGLIVLIYNTSTGVWEIDNRNVKFSLPEKITVDYEKNFKVYAGEETEFMVTYRADNPDTKSEGIVKIVYTISWK